MDLLMKKNSQRIDKRTDQTDRIILFYQRCVVQYLFSSMHQKPFKLFLPSMVIPILLRGSATYNVMSPESLIVLIALVIYTGNYMKRDIKPPEIQEMATGFNVKMDGIESSKRVEEVIGVAANRTSVEATEAAETIEVVKMNPPNQNDSHINFEETSPPNEILLSDVAGPSSDATDVPIKMAANPKPDQRVQVEAGKIVTESGTEDDNASNALELANAVGAISGQHSLDPSAIRNEAVAYWPDPVDAIVMPARDDEIYNMRYNIRSRPDERVKAEVMRLIVESPNGILSRDLYKKYRERYGRSLRYNNRDFISPVRMLQEMDLKVLITRSPGDFSNYLFKVSPNTFNNYGFGGSIQSRRYWSNCLQYGDSIPSLPIDVCRPGQLFLATIAAINSPSDFVFLKYGDHVHLEHMSAEMLSFYNGPGVMPEIPRSSVLAGLYCSAMYDGAWYRARITEVLDGGALVQVHHVDYGFEGVVPVSHIRPLRSEWAQLPEQAIWGRLDSVGPPARYGRQWPLESVDMFHRMVHNRALFVHVVAMNHTHSEPIAEVALFDTSSNEDYWLDIELVRAGLAEELIGGPRHLHRRSA